ncbi:hypothetical protein EPN87_04510 [archaeon]|nr:MAG: hypothetical protein EPN87_04510 [archaeon]
MKLLVVAAFSFLLLLSPAFALNITVSADKAKVMYGENFTLSGAITYDNGTAGQFDYRAAVVAPKGIIVCDSKKTTTAADGTFSLTCSVPTSAQAAALGIPAVATRAVMPLRAGVTVLDPTNFTIVKKYAGNVLAINQDKLKTQLSTLANDMNAFVGNANAISAQCNSIISKAQARNLTLVANKCQSIKDKVASVVSSAKNITAEAREAEGKIGSANIEGLRDRLSTIRENMKGLIEDVKDAREEIKSAKWEAVAIKTSTSNSAGRSGLSVQTRNTAAGD